MFGVGVLTPTATCLALPILSRNCNFASPTYSFSGEASSLTSSLKQHSLQPTVSSLSFSYTGITRHTRVSVNVAASSSAAGADYVEEPATKVKFQTSLSLHGCSRSLNLLGTGYREKVFAIIGVKVYAAGLFLNPSIFTELSSWKDQPAASMLGDASLFKIIFHSPAEKSLQIVLVRDVDGKTFWDALNDAISPRIKSPNAEDEYALSLFRQVFEGRPLNKGTYIFLTWSNASKLLVSISNEGLLPSDVAATIESANVNFSLFDVFFGDSPVSPSLKSSVADGLSKALK